MPLFLKGIPFYIGLILACVILIPIHFWITGDIKADAKVHEEAAVKSQTAFDIEQCAKNTQPATKSDSNEIKTLNDNLNACLGKLRNATRTTSCVPVTHDSGSTQTGKSSAPGLTFNAIDAHNMFCDQQIDSLNGVKDWAQECLANHTCQ